MVEFGRYYINFIRDIFQYMGSFFKGIFEVFSSLFIDGLRELYEKFILSSLQFSLLDWVMFVIVTLVNLIFIVVIIMKLIGLTKKYIKFVRTEIEKDDLVAEIAFLNQKTMELIDEKNKILALKVSNLGINPDQDEPEVDEEVVEDQGEGRFVKLSMVDQEYQQHPIQIGRASCRERV